MLSRQVLGTVEWYCFLNLVLMLTVSDAFAVLGGPPSTVASIDPEADYSSPRDSLVQF